MPPWNVRIAPTMTCSNATPAGGRAASAWRAASLTYGATPESAAPGGGGGRAGGGRASGERLAGVFADVRRDAGERVAGVADALRGGEQAVDEVLEHDLRELRIELGQIGEAERDRLLEIRVRAVVPVAVLRALA